MRNPYAFHGVYLEDTGTQLQGDCPFCGKANHFFVNDPKLHNCTPPRVPWGWSCHSCMESGNLYDFLHLMSIRCELDPDCALDLHQKRGITPETARRFGLFTTPNSKIVIPCWSLEGRIVNLYRAIWHSGKGRVILASTPGCAHHLYCGQHLSSDVSKPVWLCEGQWDTLLLSQILPNADVCGTPGTVFKRDWTAPFEGRRVNFLLDNDEAGQRLTERIAQYLENSEIHVLSWPRLTEISGWENSSHSDISDLFLKYSINAVFRGIKRSLLPFRSVPLYKGGGRDETEFPNSQQNTKNEKKSRIDWRPLPISRLEELATPIDWIWDGYVARRCCTLLVAIHKVGKTSLLVDFFSYLASGGTLETTIKPANVLIITEEDASLWITRRDTYSLADNVHVSIRPVKGRPDHVTWDEIITLVEDYSRAHAIDILVLDTFARLSPLDSENDAVQMTDAYMPLERLYDQNMAIILVHHSKKGDASEGHAARGSTALGANVDIILELRRPPGKNVEQSTKRTLRAYSRFEITPKHIELDRHSGRYVSRGSKSDQSSQLRQSMILTALTNQGPITLSDLTAGPDPMSRRSAAAELARLTESGKLVRTGTGRKGDPYIYTLKPKEPQ